MSMHQDNTDIQEQGCGALGKIWNRFKRDTEQSTWRGYESRVISVILQSMGAHTQHEGIQQESKKALAEISDVYYQVNYEQRDNCAAKVSTATIEMMKREPSNTKYWCQVLSYLCTSKQVQKHGGNTVVSGIIGILKAHQADIAIQEAGYQTLSTILLNPDGYNPLYARNAYFYTKMEEIPAALPTSEAQRVVQEFLDSPGATSKIIFKGKQLLQQLQSQKDQRESALKKIQSKR